MPCRLSGRWLTCKEVFTAIMPQPISTPTAAGMIAPRVGITLPTVAPIFFDRFSSSIDFSIWQPKYARQTLGDKLVCI